jgi:hypothetical protein
MIAVSKLITMTIGLLVDVANELKSVYMHAPHFAKQSDYLHRLATLAPQSTRSQKIYSLSKASKSHNT